MEADAARPARLRCKSCGAPIFWAMTTAYSRVPLNAEPVEVLERGHYAVDWPSGPDGQPRALARAAIHLTHFATCPHASEHRRR